MDYNKLFAEEIAKNLDGGLSAESIVDLVEKPKFEGQGEYCGSKKPLVRRFEP